eukprot:13715299-Heterocapsa_arctica.AAC.1
MDNLRLGRKCSIVACNHVAAGSKGGMLLCSQHLLPEEVVKNKTTRSSTRTSPLVAVSGSQSLLSRGPDPSAPDPKRRRSSHDKSHVPR